LVDLPGGKPFTKTSLHKLLTNVAYISKIKYKTEVHDGEHAAIVDADVWQRVQALLQRNGRTGGAAVRNKFGALLKGLLRCVPCDCAMTPTCSTKNGTKRYSYYVCSNAQKRGWHTCPPTRSSSTCQASQWHSVSVQVLAALSKRGCRDRCDNVGVSLVVSIERLLLQD
jgi:hypothetical protein